MINAVICIPYNKALFGEASRAETIAQHLEEVVRKTTGVTVKKWEARHSSLSEEE